MYTGTWVYVLYTSDTRCAQLYMYIKCVCVCVCYVRLYVHLMTVFPRNFDNRFCPSLFFKGNFCWIDKAIWLDLLFAPGWLQMTNISFMNHANNNVSLTK